ncbi:hypothetical protein [Afipia clevelandensis]|uniref:Uncharacterized protein n=1 Tax=Afipia clevelandensis ATCC 49720 TaxID=883079 RepID=K8NNB4_9BRAD|nr:hypothetical protein [Afipia clevelandensis]EKS31817.1 hypothetical protein HMPREF9696_04038 [Afipia clevelandensis ATCC 49720]
MRLFVVVLLKVMVTASAQADDGPKSIKTLKIQQASQQATMLYVIDSDGTVRIDWGAVEALSASKADRTLSPFADVMLAIRGETWKAMR